MASPPVAPQNGSSKRTDGGAALKDETTIPAPGVSTAPADKWASCNAEVVLIEGNDYITYIAKDGSLGWEIDAAYTTLMEGAKAFDAAKWASITNRSEYLETIVSAGLTGSIRKQSLQLIAASLMSCFDLNYDGAKEMQDIAERFIKTRNEEISRYWYLLYAICGAAPFMATAAVFLVSKTTLQPWIGQTAYWAILGACAGAIGSLFSIVIRSGKISFDAAAGEWLHALEAVGRILAGVISGIVVYIAIKAGLILSSLVTGPKANAVTLIASLVAGTGERLVGSIISDLETSGATKKR